MYEKSFYNFKQVYFKIFGAPGTTPFWQTQEGTLKINYCWNKNFHVPRIDEGDLSLEERMITEFFF